MHDWKERYDKVCDMLKSDGLKFEEALTQQERDSEQQITEVLEEKRKSLHVESEKSTLARKDTSSMKRCISMLQGQLKTRKDELDEAVNERDDLRKKLKEKSEMLTRVIDQLKEQKKSLEVKDGNLKKLREQMKHLESFRFVLYHRLNALEEERDPLEQQVTSLKTSVQEMYNEFVKEFREKQQLDQQLSDNSSMVTVLRKETVELRARLARLRRDGQRLLQDVDGVLHADSVAAAEQMPRRLAAVLEKHKGLSQWAKPASSEKESKDPPWDDVEAKNMQILQEMVSHRELLFRKNQTFEAMSNQSKQECAQDLRRLASENAFLISEINRLREEKTSYQRHSKEMEATLMGLEKGKRADELGMKCRADSAPDLSAKTSGSGVVGAAGSQKQSRSGHSSGTPFMRRKVMDQQRQQQHRQKQLMNQLPPMSPADGQRQSASDLTRISSVQEKRFAQTMDSVQKGRQSLERQGFDMEKLRSSACDGLTSEVASDEVG